jgi:hypothetical protein
MTKKAKKPAKPKPPSKAEIIAELRKVSREFKDSYREADRVVRDLTLRQIAVRRSGSQRM